MKKRIYTIYALIDPRDNAIRYIGITVNPDERLKQHIWGDMNIRKREWISELNQSDLAPIMQTIETAETEGTALEREAYWIQYYLSQGVRLVNILMTPYTNSQISDRTVRGKTTLEALIMESGLKRVSLAAQSGVTTASIIRICQGAPTSKVTVIKLLRVLRNYLKRDIKIEDIDGLNITK